MSGKNKFKTKHIVISIISSICFTGIIFMLFLGNSYMLNKSILFDKDAWFKTPDSEIITNENIYFSNDELENIKVTLSEKGLFYYNQLTDEEKEVFDYIYLNIQKRINKIRFKDPISIELLNRIVYIINFDCPEYYYVGDNYDYDLKNKEVIYYYPEYIISEKKYNKMQNEIEKIVKEVQSLVENKTEYEAQLIIHDYILKKSSYTIETKNCNNIYGALIEGQANCEGYSSSFMYLLRKVGIEATQVIGEISYNKEIVGHSWNLVKIEGEYYYSDVCWDDLSDTPEYEDIKYHYAFFNLTYEEMLNSRNVDKTKEFLGDIPKTVADKYNYYKNKGLYINNLSEAKDLLEINIPQIMSSNEKYFVIKCNNKETYTELLDNINSIMQNIIKDKKLAISKCKYAKIENGYTLIIHGFTYTK